MAAEAERSRSRGLGCKHPPAAAGPTLPGLQARNTAETSRDQNATIHTGKLMGGTGQVVQTCCRCGATTGQLGVAVGGFDQGGFFKAEVLNCAADQLGTGAN